MLNEKYKIPNLRFIEHKYDPYDVEIDNKKTLCIARMALAYLNPKEVKSFLTSLYKNDIDIAISDVGRFRLNDVSKISYTQNGVLVYSHPYINMLKDIGFVVKIDMQRSQALMNFTTYLFPEYHIMIYATIQPQSNKNEP